MVNCLDTDLNPVKAKTKPPKTWLEAYPNAEFSLITKENFIAFLT